MKIFKLIVVLGLASMMTACAHSNRVSSNISKDDMVAQPYVGEVKIVEGDLDVAYEEIQDIEVTLKKLTLFHPSPTREQANQALQDKARQIGADAVINTQYKSGVGMTTWGYLKASGIAVKTSE